MYLYILFARSFCIYVFIYGCFSVFFLHCFFYCAYLFLYVFCFSVFISSVIVFLSKHGGGTLERPGACSSRLGVYEQPSFRRKAKVASCFY